MTSDEPAVRPPLDDEVPASLTNGADVPALLAAGGGPAAGSPPAFEVARFLDLPDRLRQLDDGPVPEARMPGPLRPAVLLPAVLLGALLAGGLVGLVGAFLVPLRLGSLLVPASPAVALVGNTLVGLGAARLAGRAGSAVAGLGWLVVVGALSSPGPGGDLVLPATPMAYAFLVVGALASAATVGAAGLVRPPARAR